MMTFTAVHDTVRTLTMPPTVTATARYDVWEGPYVRFVGTVPDAMLPGEGLDIGVDWYPSPNDLASRARLERALVWRLARIAGHEVREFVQRDGRPLYDPHARERRISA
jgi:hypothetical protein